MFTPSHQATGRPCQGRGFFQIIGFSNRKKPQSISSNIQPPPQGKDRFENRGLPLTSKKMWRAACRGVSPSVREMLRGSAPLVRRRKANSKSWCCRHMASGLAWLSWRPSGKAGGSREGPRELHSRDKVQPGHLEAGPPLPLFPGKSWCSPDWRGPLPPPGRQRLPSPSE